MKTRLVLNEDVGQAVHLALEPGELVYQTVRSPIRTSPNQDGLCLVDDEAGGIVMAIADGAGGHESGEEASRVALTVFAEHLGRAEGEIRREQILEAIELSNEAVTALRDGATTFVVAHVCAGSVRTYHVGDSAALLFGQRGLRKHETIPHSPTGYAVEAGVLDEDEALHHAERHVISNALGSEELRIEMSSVVRLAARDTLLVASDGLFDNLQVDEIIQAARVGRSDRCLTGLMATARHRMMHVEPGLPSKPDDTTVILYRPTRRAGAAPW